MRRLACLAVALAVVAAGCLSTDDAKEPLQASELPPAAPPVPAPGLPPPPADWPACEHPWPCADGSEWPPGLAGPFELLEIVEHLVPSFDGTALHGYVLRPAVPEGVRVPVVLSSTIYYGQVFQTPKSPTRAALALGAEVPEARLIAEGYAVAYFSVRGTGQSGGCLEWWGPNEQRDQAWLVEWLGAQSWSNGRVAIMGGSYGGTTPWMAAIQNPPSLKTIVPVAGVVDAYTFSYTPQGAPFVIVAQYLNSFTAVNSLLPPLLGDPAGIPGHAQRAPDRLCEPTRRNMHERETEKWLDERDAGYWAKRRFSDGFPNLSAAVFLVHGFQDRGGSGHAQHDLLVWSWLREAPKRQLQGQWAHEMPDTPTWEDDLLAWFDFWLKGIGEGPPGLGHVEFEDNLGGWHESVAWPPVESREEVLYLAGGKLAPAPSAGSRAFLSSPGVAPRSTVCQAWIQEATGSPPIDATGLVYVTEPLKEDVLLAGNPIGLFPIKSDRPGGQFAVDLFVLDDRNPCTETARQISGTVVDLRFHQGNLKGIDFPVGAPTAVRVDLEDIAEWIPAGHRLAVVVSHGRVLDRHSGGSHVATLSIEGQGAEFDSHIVLPILRGTLGGLPPTIAYPPRPFAPV
ncbi:MAG TPA: CocE/NonD family hydrolase [Candidatus Thermoplasmatota archaeon]|nr:CocE/NonD family hydrolase [Candidatus Thermoplasmatota archaeon]